MVKRLLYHIVLFSCLTSLLHAQNETQLNTALKDSFASGNYNWVASKGGAFLELSDDKNYLDIQVLIGDSYSNTNKEDSSFVAYKLALKGYENLSLKVEQATTNFKIYNLIQGQSNPSIDNTKYFNAFYDYAKESNDPELLGKSYNELGRINYRDKDPYLPKNHFLKAYEYYVDANMPEKQVNALINVGAVYNSRIQKRDSARYYYNKALQLFEKDTSIIKDTNTAFNLYNNIGNTYRKDKDYTTAISYYKKAEQLALKKYPLKSLKILYGNFNAAYYYNNEFKNAYTYLYKYDSIKNEINLADQNIKISEVQEQFDNEKLRADNLEIDGKRQQNKNILIGISMLTVLISLIGFLGYKNTKRAQLLAEKDKAIEQQKVVTLLKEQELSSIDAMIAGQEKERAHVANELHDDLGSLMATVKLHFNNISADKKDNSLQKAKDLLEDAYQKIRGIAHAKNSGVMAKKGLLPSIQNMANTISASNTLAIEVLDFGLEDRLENSLELSIFRIVQELLANIIKHANATKVTIQLTQHKTSLNLLIEDNGKGFIYVPDKSNNGMGLQTIEKRIEHLEGNFTVDSVVGKGTSVVIDIPL